MHRRTFAVAVASATAASMLSFRGISAPRTRTVLYRSIGDTMTRFDVDVESGTLTSRASLQLPSVIQYAWFHPTGRYLYACTSDAPGGNVGHVGNLHRLCAMSIGADGALALHGEPTVLTARPVHNSVDTTGKYALVCYPSPADLSVHRINEDGTVGALIPQTAALDKGIFAHQIRTTPTNHSVVLVTRGINATADAPEQPGALKLYHFRDGQLSSLESIQVGDHAGLGYGPRHLDFHPNQPWVYVAIERENQLHMHQRHGDTFAAKPSFIKRTTEGDYSGQLPQTVMVGAIQVHPRGHTVYVSTRDSATVDFNGQKVFRGGENSIGVFAIDPATGEPTIVQRADPGGFHVRAFSVDPSGRLLVSASMVDMLVHEGDTVRHVPAGLSVFRIGADGRLDFVRKYDTELNGEQQLWVGMSTLGGQP